MSGHLDWGGTCFVRYGHHGHTTTTTTAFTSKTDEIMSKYRRIAPRPSPHGASNPPSESKSNANSALDSRSRYTTQRGNKNTESSSGRPNRTRRRGVTDGPNTPSPRAQKRAKAPNNPIDLQHSERSTQVSVGTNVAAGADKPNYVYISDESEKLTVEKDSEFMERAAASAFTEKSVLDKKTVGFGGLTIKGVINSVVEVGVKNPARNMEVVPVQKMPDTLRDCESAQYLVFPIVTDIVQQPQEEEKNERNLVTLSLLPETPSLRDSPITNSASTEQKPDMPNASCGKEEFQKLRLFGRDYRQKVGEPCQIRNHESPEATTFGPSVDLYFLEQMYSGSLDPLILLLDSDQRDVLWFNLAYRRMVKDAEERSSSIYNTLSIIPRPLACFSFRSVFQGIVNRKAILWGFMKNFTSPESVTVSYNESPDSRKHNLMPDSSSSVGHHMLGFPHDPFSGISPARESISPINKGVITPQPVRPVGSIVSIEYIKEIKQQVSLCKTLEEIEDQIETENFPALISDSKNRIKWANSVYKKMVGQPECSWLESTVCCCNSNSGHSNSCSNRISGGVVLNYEIPLPASSFSCCARVQWTNNKGEKSSIMVPCDVVKFVTSNPKPFVYAWKFHISNFQS